MPPEKLPPAHDSLEQHMRRALFQVLVWRNALVARPDVPLGYLRNSVGEDVAIMNCAQF